MVQGKLHPDLSTHRVPYIGESFYPQLPTESVDIFDKLGELAAARFIRLSMATLVERIGMVFLWQMLKYILPVSEGTSIAVYENYNFIPLNLAQRN